MGFMAINETTTEHVMKLLAHKDAMIEAFAQRGVIVQQSDKLTSYPKYMKDIGQIINSDLFENLDDKLILEYVQLLNYMCNSEVTWEQMINIIDSGVITCEMIPYRVHPLMTSTSSPSPYKVNASGILTTTGIVYWDPGKAFDGDIYTTRWQSPYMSINPTTGVVNEYLEIDMGEPTIVDIYRIRFRDHILVNINEIRHVPRALDYKLIGTNYKLIHPPATANTLPSPLRITATASSTNVWTLFDDTNFFLLSESNWFVQNNTVNTSTGVCNEWVQIYVGEDADDLTGFWLCFSNNTIQFQPLDFDLLGSNTALNIGVVDIIPSHPPSDYNYTPPYVASGSSNQMNVNYRPSRAFENSTMEWRSLTTGTEWLRLDTFTGPMEINGYTINIHPFFIPIANYPLDFMLQGSMSGVEIGEYSIVPIKSDGISASSNEHLAYRAFDSSVNIEWTSPAGSVASDGSCDEYLQVYFGEQTTIQNYSINVYLLYNRPLDYTLQGSDDGETWDILHTVINAPEVPQVFYTLSTPCTYSYYRLHITKSYGGFMNTRYVGIDELRFYNGIEETGWVTLDTVINRPLVETTYHQLPTSVSYPIYRIVFTRSNGSPVYITEIKFGNILNGDGWTVLKSVINRPPERESVYMLDEPVNYKYYRLHIKRIPIGSNAFQINKLRLFSEYECTIIDNVIDGPALTETWHTLATRVMYRWYRIHFTRAETIPIPGVTTTMTTEYNLNINQFDLWRDPLRD